jgi:cytochrome c oxidase subunit 2
MTRTEKIMTAALILGLAVSARPAGANDAGAPQVIAITAGKFHFTPDHITLMKGQPVTLRLTSTDTAHGFLIRALHLDAQIKPGSTTDVTVTPETAGSFKAICDHYCGLGHGGMKMQVEVKEQSADSRGVRLVAAVPPTR